jgi:hypothetical protein
MKNIPENNHKFNSLVRASFRMGFLSTAPLPTRLPGATTVIVDWRHYGDNQLAPLR